MLLNSNPRDVSLANPGFAIERYWDLEDIGMKEPPNQLSGDDEALKFHSSTLERAEDGRYQLRWPWKQGHPDLPDNFALARGRLKSLMKRLDQNPELLGAYQKIIKDQLEKGIIEVAPAEPTGASVYYMPHHCVVTPTKTTTKLRIVYDASSKSRSDIPSLNDCLHRGPVLLEDLCGLIMRFRLHRIGLVSDIEKAFLQIGLQEEDRDVTRFLWIKNGSQPPAGSNLEIYRFCRVPFGVISSPFVLENTMCQHLTRSGTALARKILKDHYVDNVITGENDVDSAVVHYHESKQIFKSACMNLREWYSNSVEVRALFSDADRGIEQEPKILGLRWNFAKDVLRCDSLKKSPSVSTKRPILQSVSQVFDPLGFYSPITVAGKILIQELWKCGYQWDQPLPGDVVDRWKKVQENLELISVSEIPRFIGGPEGKEIQLHVFCDASVKACAAVVFLKSESSCNLVMAKTRLAPTKINQTIPRLELIAVVIGVRLVTFVKEQIHVRVAETFLWTDSQCTLHWILKERVSSRFIKNRVDEIRKHSGIQFRYVPSEDNPADLPSRGCDVKMLRESSKWWHGPKWLAEYQKQWPVFHPASGESPNAETLVAAENLLSSDALIDESRFSSLTKLLRPTAYVMRFVENLKRTQSERLTGYLSTMELRKAQTYWILSVQQRFFTELVKFLGSTWPRGIGQQLNLFRDADGILRSAGRIDASGVPYSAKNPVLFPKTCHFSDLVIRNCHERLLHAGPAQTLAEVRLRYWIINGRNSTRRVLRSCQRCVRVEGGPYRIPPVPSLPKLRVAEAPAFSNIGLDYLGPLLVRNVDGLRRKVWIYLYTCMVVRAVHLDVVEDLSADQFLMSLRRFIAMYGSPRTILSDNASQFHSSRKTLEKMWTQITTSERVHAFAVNRGIKWEFIVEFSPWMGGFYERLVGSVKRALKKTLDTTMASFVELQTVIAEISATVNSRPLVYPESEISFHPLTPSFPYERTQT